MVDIFGMTLEVISRPLNIELPKLHHFSNDLKGHFKVTESSC